MALLTPEYEKLIRREKLTRLLLAFILLICVAVLVAIIFMLPSYFFLAFSKTEILRRLEASKEVLATKDLKNIEERIESINKMVGEYEKNEAFRHKLSPILIKIFDAMPPSVKLKFFVLKRKEKDGNFTLTLDGRAATRGGFLDYLERLKLFNDVEEIISPVANLLRETDATFSLDLKLKKEIYGYE